MCDVNTKHKKAIDLLLGAIYNQAGEDGMECQFFFGTEPNAPHRKRNIGATIYISLGGITEAVLFVRRYGPSYLQDLSIERIQSMLQDFFIDNFHDVASETIFRHFTGSYADQVSDATKFKLARSLIESSMFLPVNKLSLYPLVPVVIVEDFTSDSFFLRKHDSLHKEIDAVYHRELTPDIFPPLYSDKSITHKTNAWLGIRSPEIQISNKWKSIILGAVALTLPLRDRYMFSERNLFGGICTISNRASISFTDPHTPPLMENLTIRQCDKNWLEKLAIKLISNSKEDRRHKKAIEYYFSAWSLTLPERFPFLCMSLDAIYSEAGRATKSVVEGVRTVLGEHIDGKRIRRLLDLRASVIHGGAPEVYDSKKYIKYYQIYRTDPINDLDEIVTESLRRQIFEDSIVLQDFPSHKIISNLQESGRLPKSIDSKGILISPSAN